MMNYSTMAVIDIPIPIPYADLEPTETTPLLGTHFTPKSEPIRCRGHILILCTLGLILFGGIAIATYLLFTEGQQWSVITSFDMVNRKGWRAIEFEPRLTSSNVPPSIRKYVIMTHTEGETCNVKSECKTLVRELQAARMNRTINDLQYNFLIGGDGHIYEGLGWEAEDGLNHGLKDKSLSVALIGNFTKAPPPESQLNGAKALIIESIRRRKLHPHFILIGETQINGTKSTDDSLLKEIQNWDHWKPCFKNC